MVKESEFTQEGRQAFRDGKTEDDCPYPKGNAASGSYNPGRCDWFTGYLDEKHRKMFPKLFKEKA